MSANLLDAAELKRVSGAGLRSGQIAWLREEGIPFKINRKDELVVCWRHVHAWIEGRPAVRSSEPDFSSLGG
jgi:hypothetical protein